MSQIKVMTDKVNLDFARSIIEKIRYMNIATTNGEQPWNTAVARSYDDNLNFYWVSHIDSVHSKNIRKNPNVFITIYDSTVPSEEAWGVYFQARAEEINDDAEAERIASKFLSHDDPYVPKDFKKYIHDKPKRIYRAVPIKMWMNDEGELEGEYIDIRTAVDFS